MSDASFLNLERRLLISRVLTRAGDQAWDFVVPFALLHVFPGKLQIAALYYLIIKIGTLAFTSFAGRWIDSSQRGQIVKIGVWGQFFAVFGGMVTFWWLEGLAQQNNLSLQPFTVFLFLVLSLFGVLASLGSTITDISLGNDLAPALVPASRLTGFNAWLKRIDLGTEVGAPILAGALFLIQPAKVPLLGFFLIGIWNLVSFIPEYLLLRSVARHSSLQRPMVIRNRGWKELFQFNIKESLQDPIFPLMLSYALLWLSVLSPHGVLLSGYLKDEMALPESQIGIFRGLGAVFGLLSTLTFPFLVRKVGLIQSARAHLFFQGAILFVAMVGFTHQSLGGVYVFLVCILLSRVGLYGFSNGEFELRQRMILPDKRGELNSMSYLMTTLATLVLFAAGSLLPHTEDFKFLVYGSFFAVVFANVCFFKWAQKIDKNNSKSY